jgi:hypothetical protein
MEEVPVADGDGHCNADYCDHGGNKSNFEEL